MDERLYLLSGCVAKCETQAISNSGSLSLAWSTCQAEQYLLALANVCLATSLADCSGDGGMSVLLGGRLRGSAFTQAMKQAESGTCMPSLIWQPPVISRASHHDFTSSHYIQDIPPNQESEKVGVTRRGMFNDHKNKRHDDPWRRCASLACMPSRLLGGRGCAICRFGAGIQLMHNTTRRRPPAPHVDRRSAVDPAVHCVLQLACGVSALHSTTASDSCAVCERTRSWCNRMRPQLRSCVPALVGDGNGSRRATRARSTGKLLHGIAYSSRPVTSC